MKKVTEQIPTFDEMMLPTVQAIRVLGDSGTVEEIYNKVVQILNLPDSVLNIKHGNTSQTEVEYRLHWSRTYLKKYGVLENSARGVWAIAANPNGIDSIDPKVVVRTVRDMDKKTKIAPEIEQPENETPDVVTWEDKLHSVLLQLKPDAFERLAQRLLRESGFIQVEVTGRSGDGGIDGIGIARIAGFLSFHVLFQCKRYQGAITPSQIRDFRGAMQGRTDKGLFITTGTFTREAVKEATRDGAPPIDLIDGEQLVQRLKELGLGVKIQMVENVEIDAEWFSKI